MPVTDQQQQCLVSRAAPPSPARQTPQQELFLRCFTGSALSLQTPGPCRNEQGCCMTCSHRARKKQWLQQEQRIHRIPEQFGLGGTLKSLLFHPSMRKHKATAPREGFPACIYIFTDPPANTSSPACLCCCSTNQGGLECDGVCAPSRQADVPPAESAAAAKAVPCVAAREERFPGVKCSSIPASITDNKERGAGCWV